MVITFLFLALGCTTLSTMNGAKTIEPNTWRVGVGASLQKNNPFSYSLGIPSPQVDLSVRYGLRDNVDIGTRIYIGGLLADLRYQFWKQGEWTFAIAPGIGGLATPIGGVVDLRLPIRFQRSVKPNLEFVTGFVPISQNSFALLPSIKENYMNNHIGGFARLEWTVGNLLIGSTVDVLDHSSRGLSPSWNIGMDFSMIKGSVNTGKSDVK